jgi:hypothetical protein
MNFIQYLSATALVVSIALACPAIAKDKAKDKAKDVGRVLSPAEQEVIKTAVGERLFDAEAARYKFAPYKGGSQYCGQVNAKNRFGAYVGFVPFQAVVFDKSGSEEIGVAGVISIGDPDDSRVTGAMCKAMGY